MNPYDRNTPCPKCGHCGWHMPLYQPRRFWRPERIRCKCLDCKATWYTAPLDAHLAERNGER